MKPITLIILPALLFAASACTPVNPAATAPPAPPATQTRTLTAADAIAILEPRLPHLDQRLDSPDPAVRRQALHELTLFHPRDTRLYVPLFRAVLRDSSPDLRWTALDTLAAHGVFVDAPELPASFSVPICGLYDRDNPDSIRRIREIAATDDAPGGWAIRALGLVRDPATVRLARQRRASPNPFTRFSAALALQAAGQTDEAAAAFTALLPARDGEYGVYRMYAAEALVRAGHREYLTALIDQYDQGLLKDSASGPAEILEDLTGVRLPDPASYRQWCQKNAPKPHS